MFTWLVNKLIERAKRTPYFHLDGYMRRWWLVPYNTVITRTHRQWNNSTVNDMEVGFYEWTTDDGTGMVSPLKRPFTWLIQKCGIAIRVHEILRSDSGRDPHDHPWPYVTIILKGCYLESVFNGAGELISAKQYGPGSILYRPAGTWHRLDLPLTSGSGDKFEPVTTLFITGPKAQSWGFLVGGKKVPYWEYLDESANGGRKG